jgi:hypothetical protein
VLDQSIDSTLYLAAIDLLVFAKFLWEGTEAGALFIFRKTASAQIASNLVAIAPLFLVV